MYIIERNAGPFTLAPKEFKDEIEAKSIFDRLRNKRVPCTLFKQVKGKKELIAVSGGY